MARSDDGREVGFASALRADPLLREIAEHPKVDKMIGHLTDRPMAG